jgi:hypothetical protein
MENQCRFDLDAAVKNWKNKLTAQPQLTPDNRRELEKRLADSVADLRGRGLSDEESFWLAKKRIGRPEKIAEEFEKMNPDRIWREQAFWMVIAVLAFYLWVDLGACVQFHHWSTNFWERLFIYPKMLINFLPAILLPILLARGRGVKIVTAFAAIFKTRWHFAASVILFIAITQIWQAFEDYHFRIEEDGGRAQFHTLDGFWLDQFTHAGAPLILLAAVIGLLPKQNQQLRMEEPA